jgi:hypothetical protein
MLCSTIPVYCCTILSFLVLYTDGDKISGAETEDVPRGGNRGRGERRKEDKGCLGVGFVVED